LAERAIRLLVPAISASERKPDGSYARSFQDFKDKVAAVGLQDAEIIKPTGIWGMTFWDWMLWGDEETVAAQQAIHDVLFPGLEFRYADYCAARGLDPEAIPADGKWRNAKCDVLTMWSHIHHGVNILVTSDENFHRQTKEAKLAALGAGTVVRRAEAVAICGAI